MSRLVYDEDGRGKRYVSEREALRLFLDLPEPQDAEDEQEEP